MFWGTRGDVTYLTDIGWYWSRHVIETSNAHVDEDGNSDVRPDAPKNMSSLPFELCFDISIHPTDSRDLDVPLQPDGHQPSVDYIFRTVSRIHRTCTRGRLKSYLNIPRLFVLPRTRTSFKYIMRKRYSFLSVKMCFAPIYCRKTPLCSTTS